MIEYFSKWNLSRIFRLLMGSIIVMQGIEARQWLMVGLGGIFSLMAVFNIAMCINNSCAVPASSIKKKN